MNKVLKFLGIIIPAAILYLEAIAFEVSALFIALSYIPLGYIVMYALSKKASTLGKVLAYSLHTVVSLGIIIATLLTWSVRSGITPTLFLGLICFNVIIVSIFQYRRFFKDGDISSIRTTSSQPKHSTDDEYLYWLMPVIILFILLSLPDISQLNIFMSTKILTDLYIGFRN